MDNKKIERNRIEQVLFNPFFVFGFIFLCHFIVLLAFYPGLCTYDLDAQILQVTEQNYCTNHPLIHTLLMGFFYNLLDEPNEGYALATILQLIIVDGIICYSFLKIISRNHKKTVLFFIILYSLFPVYSLLSISHTKDILFGAFGLLLFTELTCLTKDNGLINNKYFLVQVTVTTVLATLFRNNAVYALVATCLILVIILLTKRNKHTEYQIAKRLLIAFATSFILALIINKCLFAATDANNGSIKEMMSAPAQIMGYIYNSSANEDEKEIILSYIPNAEEYKSYIADPMKKDLPFEIWESKCKHFLLDSAKIAIHHPIDSVKAYSLLIEGFFNPFNCPYSSDHFFLARHDYRGGAIQESKIPWLCDLYVNLFYDTASYARTPIVILLNIGIYIWLVIISIIILIRKKVTLISIIPYIFPIMYLFTLMLGPAAIIRYCFIYILIAPLSLYYSLTISSDK